MEIVNYVRKMFNTPLVSMLLNSFVSSLTKMSWSVRPCHSFEILINICEKVAGDYPRRAFYSASAYLQLLD
jgi:hypothetical protein